MNLVRLCLFFSLFLRAEKQNIQMSLIVSFFSNIGKFILLKRNYFSPSFLGPNFISIIKRWPILSWGVIFQFNFSRLKLRQSRIDFCFFIQLVGSGLVIV